MLSACAPNKVEYLGCIWRIPGYLEMVDDQSYSGVHDGFHAISFLKGLYRAPQSTYLLVSSSSGRGLDIREYKTNGDPGTEVFVISRPEHEGTVIVVNHEYKEFLIQCN